MTETGKIHTPFGEVTADSAGKKTAEVLNAGALAIADQVNEWAAIKWKVLKSASVMGNYQGREVNFTVNTDGFDMDQPTRGRYTDRDGNNGRDAQHQFVSIRSRDGSIPSVRISYLQVDGLDMFVPTSVKVAGMEGLEAMHTAQGIVQAVTTGRIQPQS